MTPAVTILIPVLDRPERVAPILASIKASERGVKLTPLFLASPGDTAELDALRKARAPHVVVDWPAGPGDYSRKINFGAARASTRYVFTGADDVLFDPGWAERAVALQAELGVCVVGTNDLGNQATVQGTHATHSLVHLGYLECGTIDEPGKLLHEGYVHNFCDVEFVETAKQRGAWSHAADSIVEHLHPIWHKAQDDATYQRGQEGFSRDRRLYENRRRLWG